MVQSKSQCAYNPSYPATSPYVTAVGATYASSWATPGEGEIVCQANKHDAVITSGGGFSALFEAPSYQKSAVSSYFSNVATQPEAGYAKGGRGYPDVALSGFGYEVVIGDSLYTVCGTSCSSPSVAAMVSLINAVRLEAGASSVGFLNPAIYRAGATANGSPFNDVTSGENQCTANAAVCCSQGFYASKGWDPTTGFGSVDFTKLKSVLTADLDSAAVAAAEKRISSKRSGVQQVEAAPTALASSSALASSTAALEAQVKAMGESTTALTAKLNAIGSGAATTATAPAVAAEATVGATPPPPTSGVYFSSGTSMTLALVVAFMAGGIFGASALGCVRRRQAAAMTAATRPLFSVPVDVEKSYESYTALHGGR